MDCGVNSARSTLQSAQVFARAAWATSSSRARSSPRSLPVGVLTGAALEKTGSSAEAGGAAADFFLLEKTGSSAEAGGAAADFSLKIPTLPETTMYLQSHPRDGRGTGGGGVQSRRARGGGLVGGG